MKTNQNNRHSRPSPNRKRFQLLVAAVMAASAIAVPAEPAAVDVGLAVRDVTPPLPFRLAGYAARNRPADRVDQPLVVQAMAVHNATGERFVFVSLENCEVSRAFMQPVLEQYSSRFQLPGGAVAVVSSHTHSGPVLDLTLTNMAQPSPQERVSIMEYSRRLQSNLVEVVGDALAKLEPARLEYGLGRAAFAMNRRVYRGDNMAFGENPEGPVDWDVPVLRVSGTNGTVRAILFGYACHGTSVGGGDDWYMVSGDYMGYARQHIEAHQPGAVAMFLTGMGADSNPAPRGRLLNAKRHGLELAGAVMGVLDRPMRPVTGSFRMAYDEVELPFVDPPGRERLEQDAQSADEYIRFRAGVYLRRLDSGEPLPKSVKLPVAVVRFGDDLTFVFMGGEVVVDYARKLKRLFAAVHPWTVGYAYEVPCYIPSARILNEGGYEADSSLIYYGFYGPLRASVEDIIMSRLTKMLDSPRTQ